MPANHRNRTRIVRRSQKISEARKQHHEIFLWLALLNHQNDLAFQARRVFDFIIDIEQIDGYDLAFRSARDR